MSGRIVVGYTATDAGADALALAARLALAVGATLDVVVILPAEGRSVITPPDASYDRYLVDQAEAWLTGADALLKGVVPRRRHVRFGESFAEGLVNAADEFEATHIVVGAANGGIRGRHRMGTVATELLHTSDVPVVLAPEGSRLIDPSRGITRVTAAVGTRPGTDALIEQSVALATTSGADIRLLSLVSVDLPPSVDTGVIRLAGAAHADDVLGKVLEGLPEGLSVDVEIARGDRIEDAVSLTGWEPGEIAVVGSSRLAQPRRLFLGSTAAKMLHELPVPMVVVPRTRTQEGVAR